MVYDPYNTSTWSVKQLLAYARERGIDVPSGCEKTELIAIVDAYVTDELLAEHIRKENTLNTGVMADVTTADPATVLRHVAHPSYTAALRRHPAQLQAILDTGIEQLHSLTIVARLCSARLHSPVQAWLGVLASDCGDGQRLHTTLSSVNATAAASPVCGRFCGDQEMVVRCLDCGADSTCVMCMECFRHSPCVNHRYRITRSSGGGMCDCGDPTAWKPESFCSRHRAAAAAAAATATAAADGSASASSSGGCCCGTAADVLSAMAEEERAWVVPVLRGIVQFIAVALLQHTRLQVVQKRAGRRRRSTSSNSNSSGGGGGGAGEAEADLLTNVARIAETFDWIGDWMTPVTRQLWELIQSSDVAKRLVAQLWAEPVKLASDGASSDTHGSDEATRAAAVPDPVLDALPPHFTCVHMVFLYESSRPVTPHETPLKPSSLSAPWRNDLLRCVGHCLSDARFRFPVGGLMVAYAEYINAQERVEEKHECLAHYSVQVLTNPDVVRHLMSPAHLPYRGARSTALHRELSSLFYTLWLARDLDVSSRGGGGGGAGAGAAAAATAAGANPVTETAALSRDGLLFVAHQATPVSLGGVTALQSCLAGCPAACQTLVVSRLAWRAFAQLFGSLAISGYIRKDPSAPTESQHYPTPDFVGRCLARHTWMWVHAIRVVVSSLLRLPDEAVTAAPLDATSAMPNVSVDAVLQSLGVPAELWAVWRGATAFDAPPDRHRQKAALLTMLAACRVNTEAGEEAVLLLQGDSPMAAAQSRALRAQRRTEGAAQTPATVEEVELPLSDSVMAAPALATAMGYTLQLLYELSRTLDAVLAKQRNGFCCGCRAVVLERKNGGGHTHAARRPSSHVEEQQQQQSPCPVDVMEYTLLEPHAHATTYSNHLPRMFGAVLTAWIIEHQRTTPHRLSTASPAADAPSPSVRITGLPSTRGSPGATAHASRPLRTLLDAFFQLRAAMTGNALDRLLFTQQLLDALVMPHVLIGQVFDGLWRRGDYDVSAATSMYLVYARGVSAEFDVLMMQVLTMELAPADMALQTLQRFSYAKESKGSGGAGRGRGHGHGHGRRSHSPAGRSHPRRCMNGYRWFLRLILTLVTDVSKAAFQPPMSSPVLDRIVAAVLSHGKASHSAIVESINETARGGDYGDADEDEKDSSGNVIKCSQLVDAAIRKLAVAEDSTRGKQFRLKSVEVWRSHVDLYQVGMLDSQLEELHKTYRSIVSATRAEQQKAGGPLASDAAATGDDDGGGGGGGSAGSLSQQHPQRVVLPPTRLPEASMYAELVPTTRALLHTDAVLLPALYVLHEYTNCHVPVAVTSGVVSPSSSSAPESPRNRRRRSSSSGSGSHAAATQDVGAEEGQGDGTEDADRASSTDSDDDDDDGDANLITREALLHAVTALYLCVQDCITITRAMRAVEGTATTPGDSSSSGGPTISWELVEVYLCRFRVNESSFTHASCVQWLPLPELLSRRTLRQKLETTVKVHTTPSNTSRVHTVTASSAEMLHRLRSHLLSNKDADPYGCLEMVEAVLVLTRLATFNTAALLAEQKSQDDAALNRKKIIQERQAMLIQRMRSRAMKVSDKAKEAANAASAAAPGSPTAEPEPRRRVDGDAATAAAASSTDTSPAATAATGGGAVGSLVAKLLLELTTVDCCVCRSATEEPLFLLCHTGTSGVLPQIGALSLPDGRAVHSHISMCGHAAHKSCVEKLFIRLSVLWQRWNFRSQFYLGPTEFNCPVCTTIVTSLCPMPVLPGGGGGEVAGTASPTGARQRAPLSATTPASATSLFQELQSSTTSTANRRSADVAAELHATLANAAIGFSPSEDVPAIVAAEDALQQRNAAAWQLSEAIRTFYCACHLQLEAVKAGQSISHRHLIGMMSLLLSIVPAELQRQQAHLRANYARNLQDKENLLVLDALLCPGLRARSLQTTCSRRCYRRCRPASLRAS